MMAFNVNETFKPFADPSAMFKDFQGKLTDMMENLTGAFKAGDQAFDWKMGASMDQAEKGMDAIIKMVPMTEATRRDLMDRFRQACRSFEKVYEKYMDISSDLAREGLRINQAWMKGEAAGAMDLQNAITGAAEEMAECIGDCLTDTPFESLKSLDRTMKKSFSSFSNEEKMARAFFSEMTALGDNIARLSVAAVKDPAGMMEMKKEIDAAAFIESMAKISDAVAGTQKRLAEIAALPEPAITKYNETADNLADLSKKQLEILKAGIQIPAKCFYALADTAGGIQSQVREIVEEGKPASPERFFTQWMETVEDITRDTIEKSGLEQTIPRFFNTYAGMLDTARAHFRNAMVLPYVTHPELNQMEKKVSKPAPKAKAAKKD
jgi:glycogen debranching enzyme